MEASRQDLQFDLEEVEAAAEVRRRKLHLVGSEQEATETALTEGGFLIESENPTIDKIDESSEGDLLLDELDDDDDFEHAIQGLTPKQERINHAVRSGDGFKQFKEQAADHKLLNREQERDLALRIENGDSAAVNEMVEHNIKLIISIARRYEGFGLSMGDLINEGAISCIRAAKKFDYRREYKFSTYATWWIRQGVQRAIANIGREIRLPVHMNDRVVKMSHVEADLTAKLERVPLAEEVAEAMDVPLDQLLKWRAAKDASTTMSLDEKLSDDSEKTRDYFVGARDNTEEEAVANLENEEISKLLKMAVAQRKLSETDLLVLQCRFGLDGGQAMGLVATGRELNMTREEVRRLEHYALKKLTDILGDHNPLGMIKQPPPPDKNLVSLHPDALSITEMQRRWQAAQIGRLTVSEAQAAKDRGEKVTLDQMDRDYWWTDNLPRFGEEALGADF